MNNNTLREISNIFDTLKSELQQRFVIEGSNMQLDPAVIAAFNNIVEQTTTNVKEKSLNYLQKK